MKWRLARRFLSSTVLIVVIVMLVNTVLLIGGLLLRGSTQPSSASQQKIETIATSFKEQIKIKNDQPFITKDGQKILKNNNAWVQILNEQGEEVAAYATPENLQKKYRPVDIVQMYKYKEVNGKTVVYVGEAGKLSYFFGVENPNLMRVVYTFDYSGFFSLFSKLLLLFLIVDIIIAIIIGFLFGKRLTKPLNKLIDGIGQLKNNQYTSPSKNNGIYREVFDNMDDLAQTLKGVEIERNRLDTMKNQWISNVSHDMKTPLSSIQGYAELIKDSASTISPAEITSYSEIIENKSKYMNDLLNDLNLTTKLRSGALPLNKTTLNMTSFIRESIIDLLNNPQFEEKIIHFDVLNISIQLAADEKLLKRAVYNLINNAFIHNPADVEVSITISTSYPQELKTIVSEKLSTNSIFIKISDNGVGIPEQEQKNIFERYYRGTNTSNDTGSGLGMAIAHDIILAHDGAIYLLSKEDEGTSFYIILPTNI